MANPNPNVWGAPSSWTNTNIFPAVGSGNSTIKACKPKCTEFQAASPWYSRMSLGRGVQVGKITANQAIDNSICTNGQHPDVSPYAHIGLFKNKQSSAGNIIPDSIYEEQNQINWFFADVDAGSGGLRDHIINTTQANQRWAPNSDSYNNINYWTSPYVFYQLKSILLTIKVGVIDSYDSRGLPVYSIRTLRDWKNNYSNKPICEIRLVMNGYSQYSGSNITYASGDTTSQADQCSTVCIMNPVNNIIDYACYNVNRSYYFSIVTPLRDSGYDTTTTHYATAYKMFIGQTYHSVYFQSSEGGWNLWTEIPYSDENYELILKMASLYGCPFNDNDTKTFDINFLSEDLFLPVIPEDGIARGDYTRGVRNVLNSLYDVDSVRDLNYDPDTPITPTDMNTYSKQTYFNPVLNLSSMCKRYVLNDAAVEQLCRDLWKISDDLIHTDPNEDFKDYDQLMLDNFLVNSPIDVIVSLDKYPISDIPTGTNSEPIKYGKASGAALGKPLTVNTIFFNFSGVDIFPKFGRSFLDYSPYTTYELYIPFCGVIQIDAGDIMDHTLSVQMVMDLSTGAVTAYVMADNLCIETANGSAALNIPVSGIDSITLNAQINNALISAKSAQMQARSTGTLTGRIGGGLKSVKESLNPKTATMQKATDTWAANLADYELTHQQLNPHKIGSASAACSWSLELTCRLMIYYPEGDAIDSSGGVSRTSPKLADLTLYGHTTGFSCISSGAVSNYHGFTVGNIDTSSITGATEQERDMIKSLFARGVYLP